MVQGSQIGWYQIRYKTSGKHAVPTVLALLVEQDYHIS